MHTILVMAPISSFIIDLWDRCMNDGKRVMLWLSHVAQHMLFIMLQLMVHWLDDAILYLVSFWCVSLQIKSYIFLWRDCNNFSLHGVIMFLATSAFYFCFVDDAESCSSCLSVQAVISQLRDVPLPPRLSLAHSLHVNWGKNKRIWSPFVKCVQCVS